MLDNHHLYDFTIFAPDCEPFNTMGHRDKQVIRQYIQNFSTVVSLMRMTHRTPKILETGAGLSTIIFSMMLNQKNETIKTIDYFAHDSIEINSRGVSKSFHLSDFNHCEVIRGNTIDIDSLSDFYESSKSTLLSLSHDEILNQLDSFVHFSMDDRKYQHICTLLNTTSLTTHSLRQFFKKHGLFSNEIIRSFRNPQDEFHFLAAHHQQGILKRLLCEYMPNIIYLDSGEFSSSVEFNCIDTYAAKDSILLVQDIFFPKSIKSFFIASAILASDRWKVLWIDRTTPQGMMICQKVL